MVYPKIYFGSLRKICFIKMKENQGNETKLGGQHTWEMREVMQQRVRLTAQHLGGQALRLHKRLPER